MRVRIPPSAPGSKLLAILPVLVVRGRKLHYLSTANGSVLAFSKAVEEVCAATGLARADIAHRGWREAEGCRAADRGEPHVECSAGTSALRPSNRAVPSACSVRA